MGNNGSSSRTGRRSSFKPPPTNANNNSSRGNTQSRAPAVPTTSPDRWRDLPSVPPPSTPPPYSPVDTSPTQPAFRHGRTLTADNVLAAGTVPRNYSSQQNRHTRTVSAAVPQSRPPPNSFSGKPRPFRSNTTPAQPPMSPIRTAGLGRSASTENALELLRKYDTVFVVDDSGSMYGPRWQEAREALAGIAEVAARYDSDGVDIHFLNSPTVGRGMLTRLQVERLFDLIEPDGITPTGEKLEELLLDYLLRLEEARDASLRGDTTALKRIKPVNFVVITDGAASDDPGPIIIQAARRLDGARPKPFPLSQVGIQFVQIGNDPEAAEALQELDDGLADAHGIRDMVDTVPFSESGGVLNAELLTKILLGGINRRHDGR